MCEDDDEDMYVSKLKRVVFLSLSFSLSLSTKLCAFRQTWILFFLYAVLEIKVPNAHLKLQILFQSFFVSNPNIDNLMIPIRCSTVCFSIPRVFLKPIQSSTYLSQLRFKSEVTTTTHNDDFVLTTTSTTSSNLPSTKSKSKSKSKREPKTLIEEMKLAELSRQKVLSLRQTLAPWIKRELTQKSKYSHWNPKRKLSRQEMIKVKELKETFPQYRTVDLAQFFHISPEAVRRILKSKWVPNEIDEERMIQRKERKLLQRQETKQAALGRTDEASAVARRAQKHGKWHKRSKKSIDDDNDDDGVELNKSYNKIQSQF